MSKRIVVGLLALVALGYAGVAITLFAMQRQILFQPDTARPDLAAVGLPGLREMRLQVGGVPLLAWWLPPERGGRVVLYFHGSGGNLGDRANRLRFLAESGYAVLMPEYPGYGGNAGAPSEASLFATATAALDFLNAAGIEDRSVAVYGESLGTGVAAFLAAGRRFGAVILESPFTSIVAIARQRYWFLPVGLLVRDRFETLDRIGRFEAPLLVAVGERDDIVPPAMGRALLAAAPEPKQLWAAAEGGHEDLAQFGLLPAVARFLDQSMPPRSE